MDKLEILKRLRKASENSRLKFPKHLDIFSKNGELIIRMTPKGLTDNMQDNPAAFEGWAIAIKSICPDLANTVVIQWHQPSEPNLHFNRFLYRVEKFKECYQWVRVEPLDKNTEDHYNRIAGEINSWLVNYPIDEAKLNAEHDEAQLEREILQRLSEDACNQLPVGLFFKEKKTENARTPHRKSQIDLWSLRDNIFTVYELKIDSNRCVGIISELMFYVNVIKDINTGVIKYPKDAFKADSYRRFDVVRDNLPDNSQLKIEGVFLANQLHPLLESSKEKIMELLNENTRGIIYNHLPPDEI